ncbi:TNF receptor-associated factor homolog 1a [Mercurialis annua]|uniref:TNF receptor-associated factor homolog 1a n=1 Tax=Mercurialis annua TaxID=3986 RepID=UPI00215FEAB3|nr:TNF receptor-associated factor homolog 1a [Mercurialis annua]XP_050216228.1 TNF receptor-associated factor homolog 1a [Mercurialis annua]XP_050216229.1 TNF receptor-associated factor homolog 1a [Mercurialis annua]
MAGIASEEAGVGKSVEGYSNGQRCQSGEALAEWRSSDQVENGTPSTSPPYWDTDDDDDNDGGPKPSELYGKYTWKIEKFSAAKRELRSNAFEVGGYKWYILIYPQGCDVCNHLSLFLCVANHDKLLPGWSHFAQFTIAVVNKDPKKSKYSDTLHRFWKKEHDWGWKKFMELSKVSDGFIDSSDTLIIKAQVQVIREKADRPFRCLDCQYRRELVRVYLTNVEQICRRFVEERRGKLGRLIEDKNRWSSFCAFWLGMDQNSRRRMSREKADVILKVVVKHFFIEKEVTSTLVMDSLYSGLKALEGQTKSKKGRIKFDAEEMPAPIVRFEKDTFVLVDDVLLLLERAAMEPLPPKDEKGPQNRTKDGNSGEDFNKDSIERDERRLTELGRRTVEIYVLAHIFTKKIETAYQDAVSLKRQEELIREEAAWLAESEQKAKRGMTDKEKKSKKKQAKQRRNNRKGKDKGREQRSAVAASDKHQEEDSSNEKESIVVEEVQPAVEKPDFLEDVSDVSDSVDGGNEVLHPDSEDRDVSPVNWDTDTSEVHHPPDSSSSEVSGLSSIPNETIEKRSTSAMDDSSSTCSTDSVPSVATNGSYRGNSYSNYQYVKSPSRGKHARGKVASDGSWTVEMDSQLSGSADNADLNDVTGSSKPLECESEATVHASQDRIIWPDQPITKKVVDEVLPQKKPSTKDLVDVERSSKERAATFPSSSRSPPRSPSKDLQSSIQAKLENKNSATIDLVQIKKPSLNCGQQPDKAASTTTTTSSHNTVLSKPESLNASTLKMSEKPVVQQLPLMSRPSSAPLTPGPKSTAPVVSMVQTSPLLARSVSATGRLGPDPSPANHSYAPLSYRNAMVGNHVETSSAGFTHANSSSLGVNIPSTHTSTHTQPAALVSGSMFLPPSSDMVELNSVQSGFHFGMVARDPAGSQRVESLQGGVTDEFPHLDIINDLLDDEHGIGMAAGASRVFQPLGNGPHYLNRQCSFPGDAISTDMLSSTSSSCRFERARSYHDGGFQRSYSALGSNLDAVREYVPQSSPMLYANGHVDGLGQHQWQMTASDLSRVGMRNVEGDGSPYFNPDYSNLACGGNGYAVYRPSNGQ